MRKVKIGPDIRSYYKFELDKEKSQLTNWYTDDNTLFLRKDFSTILNKKLKEMASEFWEHLNKNLKHTSKYLVITKALPAGGSSNPFGYELRLILAENWPFTGKEF